VFAFGGGLGGRVEQLMCFGVVSSTAGAIGGRGLSQLFA